LLILLQVVLFEDLTLFDVARPFPYIIAILYLSIRLTRWQGLLASFALGLVIDIFSYSYGIHAAACVLTFYLRDVVLHSLLGVTEENAGVEPHIHTIGTSTFLLYATIMTFIHHFMVISLDVMSGGEFILILLRTIVNSVFTLLLILIFDVIFYYQQGRAR